MQSDTGDYWAKTRWSTSRRGLLRGGGAAALGLAGAALIGCGGEDEAPAPAATQAGGGTPAAGASPAATSAPATQERKYGGLFRRAQTISFTDALDPHISVYVGCTLACEYTDHAVLATQDGSGFQGMLAASWEIPDETTMIMQVQPGAKWHNKPPVDGRAVDAEDLAYNFNRIAGLFADQEGNPPARYQRRTTMSGMERAEAVDAQQVKVTFARPTSTFLAGLTDFRNNMIPRDFLEKGGNYEADASTYIGSGPYIVEHFENEVKGTFKRNPEYWQKDPTTGQQLPYFDEVEWTWLPDSASRQAAFLAGDIQEYGGVDKVAREILLKQGKFQVAGWNSGGWTPMRLNSSREKLSDPRVRTALRLVIDYKTMNDARSGEGFWEYGAVMPTGFREAIQSDEVATLPGWNPATKEADIAEAKRLMDAAGFPEGELGGLGIMPVLNGPANSDIAIQVKDFWDRVWPKMGVVLDLAGDLGASQNRAVKQDFDVLMYGLAPQPDAVLELTSTYGTEGSRNYSSFSDPQVDELLDQASGQLDLDERAVTLRKAQDRLIELTPIIVIASTTADAPNIMYREYVRGIENVGIPIYSGAGNALWSKYLSFDK